MQIKVRELKHIYEIENKKKRKFFSKKNKDSANEKTIVDEKLIGINNINMDIDSGDFISIIGHTGSGKSTFIQHLNGLLTPNSGYIEIEEYKIDSKTKKFLDIRRQVGMVFQYPEDQLFEETVVKDISYGPSNLGYDEEEIDALVKQAMRDVNLDYDKFKDKAPLLLSGGEKRKVAIASVLAMNPKVLILDEPTAGLDPKSKREVLDLVARIKEERGLTVIMVSHNMDDVLLYSNKVAVFNKGKLELFAATKDVLKRQDILLDIGLDIPFSLKVIKSLNKTGFSIEEIPLSFDELVDLIEEQVKHA